MIKNITFLGFLLFITARTFAAANQQKMVEEINRSITAVDDSIHADEYAVLHIEEHSESEGSPPSLSMYYRGNFLIAVVISVGHETWSKEFRYYYYPNGNLKKYMEIVTDRPDHPPRLARIYNEEGTVIWKNTEGEAVPYPELRNLFLSVQKTRKTFSK